MSEVIKWLESPVGERWSKELHKSIDQPLMSLANDGEQSADMDAWLTASWFA